jgi:hypothetical protein
VGAARCRSAWWGMAVHCPRPSSVSQWTEINVHDRTHLLKNTEISLRTQPYEHLY